MLISAKLASRSSLAVRVKQSWPLQELQRPLGTGPTGGSPGRREGDTLAGPGLALGNHIWAAAAAAALSRHLLSGELLDRTTVPQTE